MTCRLVALSSVSSTRMPRSDLRDGSTVRDSEVPGDGVAAAASCARNVKLKVEPLPGSLLTVMSPPIMRAS